MTTKETRTGQIVAVDAGRFRDDDLPEERAAWEARGLELHVAAATDEDAIIDAAREADVVTYMGLYTPISARVLENLPRCRLVMRYGIGIETVDLDAATRLGIQVSNAAEFCVPDVADHTLALLLSLARRVPYLDRNVRAGRWSETLAATGPVRRLNTLTVGLVGFGRIARRVATLLQPLVRRIVAHDPYVDAAAAAELGVELVPLADLLADADFVSVHTPLQANTRHLIGAAELAQMRATAYLINTSRGPVVDEAALLAALQEARIAGAALDVFESEPLALDSPLRQLENVVLTPHVAANSLESLQDLTQTVITTVLDVMAGKPPRHLVNRDVVPRFVQ